MNLVFPDDTLITSQNVSPRENIESSREESTPTNSGPKVIFVKKKDKQQPAGSKYISNLRKAFDAADSDQIGEISLNQWKNSSIKQFIQEGKLSDAEFERYFYKIDVNSNGFISWDELACHMMREMSHSDLGSKNEVANFIHKFNVLEIQRNYIHREMATQIEYTQRQDEYITLSIDSIRFWKSRTLNFSRSITEGGPFSTMLVLPKHNVLAVATMTRKLILFELDTLRMLPAQIGASPSSKEIKQMTYKQTKEALKTVKSTKLALYNIPKCMCISDCIELNSFHVHFLIGDDQGYVEAFHMVAPELRQGTDYTIRKVAKAKLHDECITKITYINKDSCYASSSMDCTIKLWRFSSQTNKFHQVSSYKDSQPIMGFLYSPMQKVIVSYGINRDAYVWSLVTQRRTFRLGGHYSQITGIVEYVTTNGTRYLITMTAHKEFRVWDSVNYRLVREWTDAALLRPENHYSCVMYDPKRFCMITVSSRPVRWAEDSSVQLELLTTTTHNRSIIGLHYSEPFDQIITVDAVGSFSLWNLDGTRAIQYQAITDGTEGNEVTATTLDCTQRRLFTINRSNEAILWNFCSVTKLAEPNISRSDRLTSILKGLIISGRHLIVRAGWDKTITLFSEVSTGQFEVFRQYSGHKADITAIAGFSYGLVSACADGELMSWALDTSAVQARANIGDGRSVECLVNYGPFVIAGDNRGSIHAFTVPKLTHVLTRDAHDLTVAYMVTAIAVRDQLMYTADTHGYVRKWLIKEPFALEPLAMQRCARDEISDLAIVHNGHFLVTTALDLNARLWEVEKLDYIGIFNENSKWDINDDIDWPTEPPFVFDPKHFAKTQQIVKQASKRNAGMTGEASGGISLANSLNLMSSQSFEEPKEEPKSILEIGREIEEYVNSIEQEEPIERVLPEDTNSSTHSTTSRVLQTSMRPDDLQLKFKMLLRPQTATRRSEIAASATAKKKPLFIPTRGTATRGSKRLPLALRLY